ncbi:MAG: hypothetical protein JWP78_324 [Mucilaginibacter sp.]|nr:hypothetical protein [Mucilaginibacter sp.]
MKAIIFKNWFGYAAMITLLCGIIYIVGQQGFRASADDPQYQMAQDAANAINKGADPKSLISTATSPAEIAETLSPYLIIYDRSGNMAAGSAVLNGKPLKLPQGVLDYIRKHGADHATWQPQPGVRQAMVGLNTAGKGYVVIAGRSLGKIEERIELLGEQVAFGWAMALLGMLVVVTLQQVVATKWNLK